MTDDALQDRGKAIEDVFFRDVDQQLMEQMRAEMAADQDRTELAAATGIEDKEVINRLIDQGISAETLASVGLIPLIAVAWADDKMEPNERDAVLRAARESGIVEGHASYALVSGWLTHRPGDDFLQAWKDYVTALKQSLDATSLQQVQKSVIERAQRVANAAGGFLGLGSTSAVEQRVIDELNAAF
ncbi:MAG: hypothetical protein ACR2NP_10620 [Pirellulaceae bacterium]